MKRPLADSAPEQRAFTGAKWSPWNGLVAAWLLFGAMGFFWTPHDPHALEFERLSEASMSHWLGVDDLGRDLFSRLWLGTGYTIVLGAISSLGVFLFAGVLLAIEQSAPAPLSNLIRSLVSAGLAVPVLFVGLLLLVFLHHSPWTLVLACAIGGLPFGFRQLRVMWMEQVGALHVSASRALGATWRHMAWFSVWPNNRGQGISLAKLLFAVSVLEFSGLAFLGLIGDPDFPELGTIMRQNQARLFDSPWLVVWPALFLSGLLLVLHVSNVRSGSTGVRCE
jgi:ABC-type dipeptide/oligopeptide/nickel transport system permease subunit